MKCILEQDPIARKQAAKIAKYRGQYDQYGNRLTRTMINTQNILNTSDEIFNNIFTDVDTKEEEEYQNIMENKEVVLLPPLLSLHFSGILFCIKFL